MIESAQLVVAVAREGSLTRAARRLDLSVGTVSRRLAALERELGVVLFERTTRSLRATPTGRELTLAFERGVDEIERALRRVRDQEETVSGTVRVTVPPSLGAVFTPMLVTFQRTFPEVRLHLIATEQRLSYTMEELDVLVRVGELQEEELTARTLATYRHVLCARPDVAHTIRSPSDLGSVAALVWGRHPSSTEWTLTRSGESFSLAPEETLLSNDYALIAQLLEATASVGELPALVAHECLEQQRLARVLPEWALPEVALTALYAPRLLPKAVRVFVNHLEREFEALQPALSAHAALR